MNIDGMMPLPDRTYTPSYGNFGIVVENPRGVRKVTWYSCREQFHNYADLAGVREFNFVRNHLKVSWVDIAKFVYQVEKHLDLAEKTLFKYTDDPNVAWVRVAAWWLRNFMRFSFFTCVLRGAIHWDGKTEVLEWVKNRTIYLDQTPLATSRFLAGYTWYTGNVRGWYRQFSGRDLQRPLTETEVYRLLIRPTYTDRERHDAVARLARQMWDDENRPFGRDEEFWFRAAEKIDARG